MMLLSLSAPSVVGNNGNSFMIITTTTTAITTNIEREKKFIIRVKHKENAQKMEINQKN